MEKKIILLVEDSPDDEYLTIQALQDNNISNKIIVVHDGYEAMEYLFCSGKYVERDIYDLPEIILLDINLPKKNGLEVLKKIRENEITELLPVIILTSSKEEQDMYLGYKLGANSYVRKPVDFEQFSNAIKQLGLYWLVINEAPPKKRIKSD